MPPAPVQYAQSAINSEVIWLPAGSSKVHKASGTAPCPPSPAQRTRYCIRTRVGKRVPSPSSTTPAIRSSTLLYQTIAEHFETWHALASAGQFDGLGDHHTPKAYVRQAFRKYLECGIFAHGFARAWCDDCGHDYFVAYSCKGRGVVPLLQHPAHGGDGGAPHRPRFPASAGAPVGAICAETLALLHAARRGGAQ